MVWFDFGTRGWEWDWDKEADVENMTLCELGSLGGLVEGCSEVYTMIFSFWSGIEFT